MLTENNYLTKLASLEFYTEGPAIDTAGNIYFTTLTGGSIMKLDSHGALREWARTACPNGQIILENGDHLVCDSKMGKVLRFSKEGNFIRDESHETCAGVKVHVPNDLLIDSRGNLYFTDSIRHTGSVFFIGANGDEHLIETGLDYPNGLKLSNDGSVLYVAESYKNRIIKIRLNSTGYSIGGYEVFIDLPTNSSGEAIGNLPDGIDINKQGMMAIAHYGMQSVQLVSADGDLITSIDTNLPCTSNVYFENDNTLIVTGGYAEPGPGAVMKIKIN